MAAFSQPVLDLLGRYGTRVAILAEGKTLADTPGLRTLSDVEVLQEAGTANTFVREALPRLFPQGVNSLEQLQGGAETLTRDMRLSGLDHYLGLALQPFDLDSLAEAREIPTQSRGRWAAAFAALNEGLVSISNGTVEPQAGLVLLPHTYHQEQAVPESRLRNAREVTAQYVEGALGLNRSEERMVLLHEKFLSPTSELGAYKLAVHEMGHALDHALERLVAVPGFGPLHRQTVDALYAQDQARVAAGNPAEEVFTSDRADDDVREYFAEAVEAYLTPAGNEAPDSFRAGNSREALAQKSPELYAYVEKVMLADFPAHAVPEAPRRSLVPEGVPDPDLEVVRLS